MNNMAMKGGMSACGDMPALKVLWLQVSGAFYGLTFYMIWINTGVCESLVLD
jgi:hypothetical protein